MTNEDKDKKEYELALLLKSEEALAGVLTLVKQHNADAVGEPRAKRLQLAYAIKKANEAVFVYFNFRMFGDDIKNLEHDLNSRQEVLRFMVIASPAPAEHVSSMGPSGSSERHSSSPRSARPAAAAAEPRGQAPSSSQPLSNEALEKKIEEILQ